MKDIQNRASDSDVENSNSDSDSTGQHPEWHPFAVWKDQIRSEQISRTAEHRVLSLAKVADA